MLGLATVAYQYIFGFNSSILGCAQMLTPTSNGIREMAKLLFRFIAFLWIANRGTFCDELSIVEHPVNQSIPRNQSVILGCLFSDRVNCMWFQDGSQHRVGVGVSIHISFISQNGIDTKDCSIEISSVSYNDRGVWRCEGMVKTLNKPVSSNDALLKVKEDIVTRNVTGDNDTIECDIGKPAENYTWQYRKNFSDVWVVVNNAVKKELTVSSGEKLESGFYRCIVTGHHKKSYGNLISVHEAEAINFKYTNYIAGGVAGFLIFVIAVIAGVAYCHFRKHNKHRQDGTSEEMKEMNK